MNDDSLLRADTEDFHDDLLAGEQLRPGGRGAAATLESPPTPWWQRRRVIALAVGVLLAAIAIMIVVRAQRAAANRNVKELAPHVTVLVPRRSHYAATVTTTGGIVARYDMPIGVEGDGGRISAILVEVGDKVHKGDVLARLDTSVAAPQVASLRAALEQSRAEAELAASDYRRAAAVANSVGALSQEEVDKRRSAAATSAARVKSAEAQLAEAEARLGRTDIRAPDDGVVLARTAEVGQTVTPGGASLFRLGRGGEVEMRAQVAEQDLPRIRVGQGVEVWPTGVTQPFVGKVRLLGAIIDPQTRLGEVRISLPPHPQLRPGAFARAEIEVGSGERPIVPQTAVLADPTGSYVYLIGEGDVVTRRAIKVEGVRPAGIVVASGLDGSERVVLAAGAFLREGEKVLPVDSKAAQ